MFLHVGNNKNIRERDIVGIFDADTATVSGVTKKFLSAAEKKKRVIAANNEVPKSFVLYIEREDRAGKSMLHRGRVGGALPVIPNTRICFSQLSSYSLVGRSENQYQSTENLIISKE